MNAVPAGHIETVTIRTPDVSDDTLEAGLVAPSHGTCDQCDEPLLGKLAIEFDVVTVCLRCAAGAVDFGEIKIGGRYDDDDDDA